MPPRGRLPELEAKARSIGKRIGGALPAGVGFCLVLFEFGPGGHLTYVSNGDRESTVNMLKELQVTLALRQDQPPGAPAAPDVLG